MISLILFSSIILYTLEIVLSSAAPLLFVQLLLSPFLYIVMIIPVSHFLYLAHVAGTLPIPTHVANL